MGIRYVLRSAAQGLFMMLGILGLAGMGIYLFVNEFGPIGIFYLWITFLVAVGGGAFLVNTLPDLISKALKKKE